MFYDPTFDIMTNAEAHERMVRRQLTQMRELCKKYGAIQQIDLDGGWPKYLWPDIVNVVKEVRKLQPNVMLRERGIGPYGDFTTPEHWVPKSGDEVQRPWQAIEQLGSSWAYQPNDSYKPKEWLVTTLVDCCAKGGNFMPGVSPMSNGRFPPQTIERLEYVGDWLKVNGEAIYKTRPLDDLRRGRCSLHPQQGQAIRVCHQPEVARRQVGSEVRSSPGRFQDCPPRRGGIVAVEG